MPRVRLAVMGLGLALSGLGPAWAEEPSLGGARVSALEGEALVQFAEDRSWSVAPLNAPLLAGDRLEVGPTGRIEVLLAGGVAIRLGPSSTARFVTVPPADAQQDSPAEIDMEAGQAIVTTAEGDRSRPVVILNVPGAQILVYVGSQVRAEAVAADATDVLLRRGAATADALGTGTPLRVGETLRVGRGEAFQVAGLPPDDFDRWSESRDGILMAAPSSSPYLPSSLAPYLADLNNHGQWTAVPEYGYVWRPTVVATGWAPFTDGRWMWRGGTWVWLPQEPWGWAPFHYGRWRWDPVFDWYWVPPRAGVITWCPGAVAWIQTSRYVTWIPLAPGEIYHSPWPRGPRSAVESSVTVINVNHVHIKKIFLNAAAPAPVVAVPVNTFKTNTIVRPPATRVPLTSLGKTQTLNPVTPASVEPVPAGRGAAIPPVVTPAPSVGTSAFQSTKPSPSAVQTAGQRPASAWPAGPTPIAASQPSVPASVPVMMPRTQMQMKPMRPNVDAGRPKGHAHPSDPARPLATEARAAPVAPQPPAAAGLRPREDHVRRDPMGDRQELRPERTDRPWVASAKPPDQLPARMRAPQSPVPGRPTGQHPVQPLATPLQVPEHQREVRAPNSFTPPTRPTTGHSQPTQQPARPPARHPAPSGNALGHRK